MIWLERQERSGACVAHISGDIDAQTAPAVREAIETAVAEGCPRVVLDLSEVGYLDSSALGLLVWADRRLGPLLGSLTLAGAGRDVSRILELSGLMGVAPSVFVADSVESALGGLEPPLPRGEPIWVHSFQVPGDARLMSDVRARIAAEVAPLGLADSTVFDIKVAAGEALSNAVRHGSPQGAQDEIAVEVAAYDNRVEITVSDRGKGFDGQAEGSDYVFSPGGRGVLFMRALMDTVEFERPEGGGTRVRLSKRRARPIEAVR